MLVKLGNIERTALATAVDISDALFENWSNSHEYIMPHIVNSAASRKLALFTLCFFPLTEALAADELYSWKAQNCPAAVPEDDPYISLMFESMGEWNQEEKDVMSSRAIRFSNCWGSIGAAIALGIDGYSAYQGSIKRGNPQEIELYSYDSMMQLVEEVNEDYSESFLDISRRVFEDAYSQEMLDMFKADSDETKRTFYEKYFCDCLDISLSEVDQYE